MNFLYYLNYEYILIFSYATSDFAGVTVINPNSGSYYQYSLIYTIPHQIPHPKLKWFNEFRVPMKKQKFH